MKACPGHRGQQCNTSLPDETALKPEKWISREGRSNKGGVMER